MEFNTDKLEKVNLNKSISQVQSIIFALETGNINNETLVDELKKLELDLVKQRENQKLLSDIANALSNAI